MNNNTHVTVSSVSLSVFASLRFDIFGIQNSVYQNRQSAHPSFVRMSSSSLLLICVFHSHGVSNFQFYETHFCFFKYGLALRYGGLYILYIHVTTIYVRTCVYAIIEIYYASNRMELNTRSSHIVRKRHHSKQQVGQL